MKIKGDWIDGLIDAGLAKLGADERAFLPVLLYDNCAPVCGDRAYSTLRVAMGQATRLAGTHGAGYVVVRYPGKVVLYSGTDTVLRQRLHLTDALNVEAK